MPAGQPLVETLSPGRATFFTYTVPDIISTVSFSLTSYVGTPALFLSTNPNSTRPRGDTPGSYCQSAAPTPADGSGGSSVSYGVVTYTPMSYSGACGGTCASYPCTLYIGVGSDDYSYYALAATVGTVGSFSGILPLYDSVPLRSEWRAASAAAVGSGGRAGLRTQLYDFRFIPSAVSPLTKAIVTVELSQVGGDAGTAVFARWIATTCNFPPCSPDTASVNMTTADYTAPIVSGAATLAVPRDGGAFLTACNGPTSSEVCTLRIAVTSVFGAQGYVVVARTDGGAQLLDGLSAMGNVATTAGPNGRPTVFFRFAHATPLAALVFTATPINGPVDMFICSTATPSCLPPSASNNATWSVLSTSPSLNAAPASVTVLPTAPGACAPPCAYYIGVRAGAAAMEGVISFSVLARTRGASTGALLDGRAVFDAVEGGGCPLSVCFFPPPLPRFCFLSRRC